MDETGDQLVEQVNFLMDKMNENCSNKDSSSKNNFLNQILLPWDRFAQWINSIVVVTFDIELGQSLEVKFIF